MKKLTVYILLICILLKKNYLLNLMDFVDIFGNFLKFQIFCDSRFILLFFIYNVNFMRITYCPY